ncbi:7-deoxyloganetic acid glucosyl transferase-like [Actinidia eriantha]|uniref:7-deoxyloganetic acid glucosyl transferase-like n=1 Tax=Actinidia eriantha TaxID=165200 RepID=UPI002586E2F7|nr:7-deoxyloganetic acid glucosyl transferase-like [Actinidia eriantha]
MNTSMEEHPQGNLPLPPHVLIFPFQAQGHVNSMLKLAELLCLAGLHVTFLVSETIHSLLLRYSPAHSRSPGFRFRTISDGIPPEHRRSGTGHLKELFSSLRTTVKPLFREMIVSSNRLSGEDRRPVTCVVADGVLSFVLDLGEELGIPVIYFRTISACAFWSYFCIPKLVEAGELPFQGNDLDVPIEHVPGMNEFLRRRDFPRIGDWGNSDFQFVLTETLQTPRAQGLILNTFEDLEGPILSHIQTQMPNLYTVGPLHAHLKARLAAKLMSSSSTSSNSFREEDKSCLTWLDTKPARSVIYVSFGSFAVVTRDQLIELWHGLVNSGKSFLWVTRSDLMDGQDGESPIQTELLEATKERGYLVGWAPQEEVLAHPSVGGFLTHSGWNSTLESIVAGVQMICWPYFADQQVNSRFVSEVWKVGLDMKDICDRLTVEKMVHDLMEVGENEFVKSANRMAELAMNAVSNGGSSYCNLDRLIEDIRSMSLQSA